MVAGWNGLQYPDGFSPVEPGTASPNLNTTNEVWSSADGITWRNDLAHDHAQFERRHAHNTFLFGDRLWMIGGDAHQGYYNHDVLSTADGVNWTTHLGPGAAADPPWSRRALQISGVYDGRMWTMGGQDLIGPEADYVHHNDVWSSVDGVTWEQVAADGPASATRWAGCATTGNVVEFEGRMWLVGCARYFEAAGHELRAEVWSTTDGERWTRHADPPWAGKIWHNVFVWDDKLWVAFGYTAGDPANGWEQGNSREIWYSADGETWQHMPVDIPIPGSHAQGVAVNGDRVLYAGGNHTFGFGAGLDRSVWQLVGFDGRWVDRWVDRGGDALEVAPLDAEAAPLWVPDAFGQGRPGVWFDGSRDVLALDADEPDRHDAGRSVLWVARAPHLEAPYGWVETFNPVATVLGGVELDGYPTTTMGLNGGQLAVFNRQGSFDEFGLPRWSVTRVGEGLQEGPGAVHVAGASQALDGTVTGWVDGVVAGTGSGDYPIARTWSRIGGNFADGGEAPHGRFAGTLGAVLIAPGVIDATTVARVQAWAAGRFGAPL
jgi:hypothetical protein